MGTDAAASQMIECPSNNCKTVIQDDQVISMVADPEVKTKYQHLITNSFVQCHSLLRWCPFPNCVYVGKVTGPVTQPIHCKCGYYYCFNCGEESHDPVNCNLLQKWLEKYSEDSASLEWIKINTKECPKCNTSIQ